MKTFRKTLSLLLTLIICFGTFSFASGASEIKTEGAWTYMVENGNATIYFCDNSITGDVTIPSKLGGYKVTTIGEGTFNNRDSITSVTVPDCVTTIGKDAFKASTLTSVKLGKGVTSIGASAFAFCTKLKSLTIPNNVKTIGDSAFSGCTSLTKLTIGSGVTTMGINVFRDCINLKELTVSEGIKTIGNGAFFDCDSLTSVSLPDSVTDIADYAFTGCNELIAVTFGKNLKTIGFSAFSGCSKLTDIYFKGTTNQWNAVTIGNSNTALSGAKVHIMGDPIIPIIPGTPSNPDTPENPDGSDDSNPSGCDCKCHSKGLKKFLFKIILFFQKIFRKNQSCSCGALHYIIL